MDIYEPLYTYKYTDLHTKLLAAIGMKSEKVKGSLSSMIVPLQPLNLLPHTINTDMKILSFVFCHVTPILLLYQANHCLSVVRYNANYTR